MTDYPERGFKASEPRKDGQMEARRRRTGAAAQCHGAGNRRLGLARSPELGPGECRRIVEAPGWQGVKYDTVKVYMCVARHYPPEFRYLNLRRPTTIRRGCCPWAVDAAAEASSR